MIDTLKGLPPIHSIFLLAHKSYSVNPQWIDKKKYEMHEKYGVVPDEVLELMNSLCFSYKYISGHSVECPPIIEETVRSAVSSADTQYQYQYPHEAADFVFSFISHVVSAWNLFESKFLPRMFMLSIFLFLTLHMLLIEKIPTSFKT